MVNLEIVGCGESRETYENANVRQRVFQVGDERGVPGFAATTKEGELIEYIADPTISFEGGISIEGIWIHHRDRSSGFSAGIIDGNNRFRPAERLRGGDEDPRLRRQWILDVTTTESGLAVASPVLVAADS